MRHYYKFIKMAKLTLTAPNAGEDVEQQELSFTVGGNGKDAVPLEDHLTVSYTINHTPTIRSSPLLSIQVGWKLTATQKTCVRRYS